MCVVALYYVFLLLSILDPRACALKDNRWLERLVWNPNPPKTITSDEIKAYMTMCKSLATLARACYPPASLRQPSLTASATCASRDTTVQLALDTLHEADYSVAKALQLLAPAGRGPVLKLDEMEAWSIAEGNLFEEALQKCGKSFHDIQADHLPWKSIKNLIAFYYVWKTTDHYLQQKQAKALDEAEHRLKQVYIPNYNKPNQSVLYPNGRPDAPVGCEGCQSPTTTTQWYGLGASPAILKVCSTCWSYWKRYGDLKNVALAGQPLFSVTFSNANKPGFS